MAYQPLTWVEDETPLSAENLNHIEQGIKEVQESIRVIAYQGTLCEVQITDIGTQLHIKNDELNRNDYVSFRDDGSIVVYDANAQTRRATLGASEAIPNSFCTLASGITGTCRGRKIGGLLFVEFELQTTNALSGTVTLGTVDAQYASKIAQPLASFGTPATTIHPYISGANIKANASSVAAKSNLFFGGCYPIA